jgi:hypothetical protein
MPITADLPPNQPLEESIAMMDRYLLWSKLAVAEGDIMQRDRDTFKRAQSA